MRPIECARAKQVVEGMMRARGVARGVLFAPVGSARLRSAEEGNARPIACVRAK